MLQAGDGDNMFQGEGTACRKPSRKQSRIRELEEITGVGNE